MSRHGGRSGPEDLLRRGCPCLRSFWDRIFKKGGGGDPLPPAAAAAAAAAAPLPPPPPPPPPTGSVYTAMWSFEAGHPDELSFLRGDRFNVVSRRGDWWEARKIDGDGRVLAAGIVPSNYLSKAESLSEQQWYVGPMNRFDAQGHLMGPGNGEGAFLVRHSERDGVGYVLSVRSTNRVRHYKILGTNESSFLIEPGLRFSSLEGLVEHYRTHVLHTAGRLGGACSRREPSRTDLSHSTVDDWTLPKAEFMLEEQLGAGCFADVYRGRWKNLINVAVKILKSDSDMTIQEFHREVNILKTLHHRCLISLFAVCTDSSPFYIITELMERGSLLSFLRGPEGALQDVPALTDMSVQVAEGMAYLEEHSSIHRDLAARNVLVGADYICKVADFGLARIIKEPIYVTTDKKIPYKWSAPEAISHGKFSNKSDVWSFGVLLYEVFTYGGIPYPGLDNQEVFDQVTAGYRMPRPHICPDFIYRVMTDCWQAAPERRPDFKTLHDELNSSTYE